jgi:hypothetical protein
LANNIFQVQTTQPESTCSALRTRFTKELIFIEVVDSLVGLDHRKSLWVRKRAQHKAKGYMIDEGRLWRVGDGSVRARARLEWATQEETVALAWEEHCNNGHFHPDGIKMKLLDKITRPKIDQSIMKAIMDCGRCKAFGSTHLRAYNQAAPIRAHGGHVNAEGRRGLHKTRAVDGRLCTVTMGDQVEIGLDGQISAEKL